MTKISRCRRKILKNNDGLLLQNELLGKRYVGYSVRDRYLRRLLSMTQACSSAVSRTLPCRFLVSRSQTIIFRL
jgi:hypothetical protein